MKSEKYLYVIIILDSRCISFMDPHSTHLRPGSLARHADLNHPQVVLRKQGESLDLDVLEVLRGRERVQATVTYLIERIGGGFDLCSP